MVIELSLFVFTLTICFSFFVIKTLDVVLQVLIVFPKIEPLRSRVSVEDRQWKYVGSSLELYQIYLSSDATLCYSGDIIYPSHGGHIGSIYLSLPSKGIGAIAFRN